MSGRRFVGLMSGTSLDGVDAVVADFSHSRPKVLARAHRAYGPELRAPLLALNAPAEDEIGKMGILGNALSRTFAEAALEALARAGVAPAEVTAIGSHGQTVRHRPDLGYTVQIGNAALLAELTGITVVADFRSRDVAAGGQGAPLAPAFHAAVLRDPRENRVVVNLGGIANITWLPASGEVAGFDCGPANCLLDLWAQQHLGRPYDDQGRWAAGGHADSRLLQRYLAEPFLALPPPKSTGRELFNDRWLAAANADTQIAPQDVQATLLQFTVRAVAQACRGHAPGVDRVLVCGGGTRNAALMAALAAAMMPIPVESTAAHGVEPSDVEPLAFAWLAMRAIQGAPGNLAAVTGARAERTLGAIYPR